MSMIFICGPSRSGTALMRSVLNRHSEIHISGETHYFDDLRVRLRAGANRKLTESEKEIAVQYFRALSHRPYGHGGEPNKGKIEENELIECAESKGDSLDAFFVAYCEINAKHNNKRIAGEKTPRHVFRIDDILSTHPNAHVICMARDPRAVVASYRNWKHQGGFNLESDPEHEEHLKIDEKRAALSYHAVTIALLWRAQVNAALSAKMRYGGKSICLVRYEDLVASPDKTLMEITSWLDLAYEDDMQTVPMHNSSFSAFSKDAGISREAIGRWKSTLEKAEIAVVDRVCSNGMKSLGYLREEHTSDVLAETALWVTWPSAVIRAAAHNRKRVGSMPSYLARRIKLILKS